MSLVHNSVLFLDELPEFKRSTLEALLQPMEDRRVTVSRAVGRTVMLVAFSCERLCARSRSVA